MRRRRAGGGRAPAARAPRQVRFLPSTYGTAPHATHVAAHRHHDRRPVFLLGLDAWGERPSSTPGEQVHGRRGPRVGPPRTLPPSCCRWAPGCRPPSSTCSADRAHDERRAGWSPPVWCPPCPPRCAAHRTGSTRPALNGRSAPSTPRWGTWRWAPAAGSEGTSPTNCHGRAEPRAWIGAGSGYPVASTTPPPPPIRVPVPPCPIAGAHHDGGPVLIGPTRAALQDAGRKGSHHGRG